MGAESEAFQWITAVCLGIGLSAACGFRVFVPMLFLSVAGRVGAANGGIDITPGFEWITSLPAIITFATATGLEIGAYYIPWLDNLLDSIATPAAVVAGTVATAACVGDIHPLLKWGLALIGGGGTAGIVQGATVLTRTLSAATTGGIGNPVVSTAEAGASLGMSIIAVAIPIVAGIVAILVLAWTLRVLKRWFFGRRVPAQAAPVPSGPGVA